MSNLRVRDHDRDCGVEELYFVDGGLSAVGDAPGDGHASHEHPLEEVEGAVFEVLASGDVVDELFHGGAVFHGLAQLRQVGEGTRI